MGRSQETFSKREKEKKRKKKKEDKLRKKEERQASSEGGGLDNMIAYVDEFGNPTDTPPDPDKKKTVVKAEDIQIGVPQREEEDNDPVHEGKVTFFNESKGYGFIRSMKDQESYFVHVNGLMEEVVENDRVTFELERGQKGMNAVNVKKA
ncbi:MAG: cold shock domain-containing protein [Fulvivirga sp.]